MCDAVSLHERWQGAEVIEELGRPTLQEAVGKRQLASTYLEAYGTK